jgi:hypothetical protein
MRRRGRRAEDRLASIGIDSVEDVRRLVPERNRRICACQMPQAIFALLEGASVM